MKRTVIAYWLIPAEPERGILKDLIGDLARRYNAPVFEPHVTIHVGSERAGVTEKVISQSVPRQEPFSLGLLDVGHSDKFTKAVFVRLVLSAELQRLNEIICGMAKDSPHYVLKPHLSLLYKKIPVTSRRELAASVELPFSE